MTMTKRRQHERQSDAAGATNASINHYIQQRILARIQATSLSGARWRFLKEGSDRGDAPQAIVTRLGQQYLAHDAELWQMQQALVHDNDSTRTPSCSNNSCTADRVDHAWSCSETLSYHCQQLQKHQLDKNDDSCSSSSDSSTDTINQSSPSDQTMQQTASDFFAVQELALENELLKVLHSSNIGNESATIEESDAIEETADNVISADSVASSVVEPDDGEVATGKKKNGMIASQLLQHYAQKDLIEEERERVRKRERSRWEQKLHPVQEPNGEREESGGVMVGGIGQLEGDQRDDSDHGEAVSKELFQPPAVDAASSNAIRRAPFVDEGEMPEIGSDFCRQHVQADEPSFPSIVWRVKERLAKAADVPISVLHELQHIRSKNRRQFTLPRLHTLHLRSNNSRERSAGTNAGNLVSPVAQHIHDQVANDSASAETAAWTAPKWYIPAKYWFKNNMATTERGDAHTMSATSPSDLRGEHKEQLIEPSVALKEEVEERVSANQHPPLASLYCSQSFKAYLVNERARVPHYLQAIKTSASKQAAAMLPSIATADLDDAEQLNDDVDIRSYLQETNIRELGLLGANIVKAKGQEIALKKERRAQLRLERARMVHEGHPTIGSSASSSSSNNLADDVEDELQTLDSLCNIEDPWSGAGIFQRQRQTWS